MIDSALQLRRDVDPERRQKVDRFDELIKYLRIGVCARQRPIPLRVVGVVGSSQSREPFISECLDTKIREREIER